MDEAGARTLGGVDRSLPWLEAFLQIDGHL